MATIRARWWHRENEQGRIRCDLCPRYCTVKPGQRSFCSVRKNVAGEMVLTTYGLAVGFCIDPVEKKPLYHFLPASSALSFGTAGCNLGCRFCQNWDTTKSREVEALSVEAAPHEIVEAAIAHNCRMIAYTYNDPIPWAEFAIEVARLARERGILNVAVTNGYIATPAREEFFAAMDATNIDLKALSDDFYKRMSGVRLEPILDTLCYVHEKTDVWLEVTNLLIPGENDSDGQIRNLVTWFVDNLGPDVPLHFTAFQPAYKLLDVPATPPETLRRAREIALGAGLRWVYTGNIVDAVGGSTHCPDCGQLLIERRGFAVRQVGLAGDGRCAGCHGKVPGHFEPGPLVTGCQPHRVPVGGNS